jgi:hypothetical protein
VCDTAEHDGTRLTGLLTGWEGSSGTLKVSFGLLLPQKMTQEPCAERPVCSGQSCIQPPTSLTLFTWWLLAGGLHLARHSSKQEGQSGHKTEKCPASRGLDTEKRE